MKTYYEREMIYKEFADKVSDAVNTMELASNKVVKIVNLFKETFGKDWDKELKTFVDSAIITQSQYHKEKWFDDRNSYFAWVSTPLVEKFNITRSDSKTATYGDVFIQFAHRTLIHEFFASILTMGLFENYNSFLSEKCYVRVRDKDIYIPYEEYKAMNFIYRVNY